MLQLLSLEKAGVKWDFGDGTTSTDFNPSHRYTSSGTYPLQFIVFGNSGCSDTIIKQFPVKVKSQPSVIIEGDPTTCVNYDVSYFARIQSSDTIGIRQWTLSNGASGTGDRFTYRFAAAGDYELQFIVGTIYGCYDTVKYRIHVNPSPTVTASNSFDLCRGNSAPLSATGAGGVTGYSWSPLQGLSCYDCPNPVAAPLTTTPYVVSAANSYGCLAKDTVVITVIQPLKMTVSPADSICIGESTNLLASGASSYSWSPAAGA